ncbi:MAG TPA: AtpZ/AtpI family protein [Candidatus Limnocylindrales bacterium]|jgi:F0F1-type ATP synthase assembly protein I|nr:AtpZ/AtpI family protein [Candidatus Limnocylindrales bacterium]
MIEPGRGVAYLALFSEIGLVLLVTTLAGVGLGYWADTQLGTVPVFILVGLFVGMGVGARAVWVLISRFLRQIDDQP